jgi:hypothetical protein
LTVTVQQDTGVVLAQADIDQLIAHTDTGAVVLSGAARRIEIHNGDGEVVTRDPISVTPSSTICVSDLRRSSRASWESLK